MFLPAMTYSPTKAFQTSGHPPETPTVRTMSELQSFVFYGAPINNRQVWMRGKNHILTTFNHTSYKLPTVQSKICISFELDCLICCDCQHAEVDKKV